MIPIPSSPESLIEHCEKYLFFYSQGSLSVFADDLNIFETGMLHNYIYQKALLERGKENKAWFAPQHFFPAFSYMMMKSFKGVEKLEVKTIERAASDCIVKMLQYADYYDKGQPQDDKQLGAELMQTLAGSYTTAMQFLDEIKKRMGEGGKNAEGEN